MDRSPGPDTDTEPAETGVVTGDGARPRSWTRFLPLALVVAGVAVAVATGATRYLSLDALEAKRLALLDLVHRRPVLGFLAYVAVYALVVGLSLPGSLVMSLTGGFLFGPWIGAAGTVVGATAGATAIFLVSRSAFGGVLRRRVKGKMVQDIEAGIRANAFPSLLVLRLIPAVPFWLCNIAAGLVEIPLRTYVAATALGIIPSSLIYNAMGSGLGHVFDSGRKPDIKMIFEPQVLLPLVGLAILSIVPALVHAWRERRRRAAASGGR